MNTYDELRAAYSQWSQIQNDYWRSAEKFAHHFTLGFREYLGAPDKYEEIGTGQNVQYVQLCKITQGADDEEHFEPTHFTKALARGDDGYFTFGVKLILERAPNAFPKSGFAFSIDLFPTEQSCQIRVYGREFTVDMNEEANRIPVFEHMKSYLDRFLQTKPWDVAKKQPIGFTYDYAAGSS